MACACWRGPTRAGWGEGEGGPGVVGRQSSGRSAHREVAAILGKGRREPVGQRGHGGTHADLLERRQELVRALGARRVEILAQRSREHDGLLRHHRGHGAQLTQRDALGVDAADEDRAARRRHQPQQRRGERRLARAGAPHDAHALVVPQQAADPLEHQGQAGAVAHRVVAELYRVVAHY